ncbi:MAG: hypothetical protein FJZ00_14220 [Candidatus Sericytochromatia bacterium]|uniref:Uncharacterized protein n=1 Tax=Candidatus Tanganyikabacteria bacterium TaxID=2961651 RepID=A0A938BPJ0_9BACT|nr:hypothetical protein [Candidatus Tanganyikabacteria bacterium]
MRFRQLINGTLAFSVVLAGLAAAVEAVGAARTKARSGCIVPQAEFKGYNGPGKHVRTVVSAKRTRKTASGQVRKIRWEITTYDHHHVAPF